MVDTTCDSVTGQGKNPVAQPTAPQTTGRMVSHSVFETLEDMLRLQPLAAEALRKSPFGKAEFYAKKFAAATRKTASDGARQSVLVAQFGDQPGGSPLLRYCGTNVWKRVPDRRTSP